jgi:hypothetical protein
MKECASQVAEIPLRGIPDKGYCWQDNELYTLFQPIVGRTALALYCHLTRRAYGATFTYCIRELAKEAKLSPATIWREFSALEHVGMIRIRKGKGNQKSKGELVNLKRLAVCLGAVHSNKAASYILPPEHITRLKEEVAALRLSLQGKRKSGHEPQPPDNGILTNVRCGNHFLPVSQRDAGVSPENRQRTTEETRAGSHLIPQDTRLQNNPSPHPPAHDDEAQETKNFPDEDEPHVLLKLARDRFNAVIDNMRAHLLDTSRPPNPRFANGFAEWENFGFNSLAVEAAERRGNELALVLSASDPAAARRGLERYRRTWEASIRKWFGSEVIVNLQMTDKN